MVELNAADGIPLLERVSVARLLGRQIAPRQTMFGPPLGQHGNEVKEGGWLLAELDTQGRTEMQDGSKATQELRPWLDIAQQQKLFSEAPLFFRSVHYPEAYPSNLAFFGIQCGLGWYPIIEAAAKEIEELLHEVWQEQVKFPENLASLDRKLSQRSSLSDALFPIMPFCSEIRETGGRLQIVITNGYLCENYQWLCIREYMKHVESLAQSVCERCGNPGKLRKGYWEHVYCDECIRPPPMGE